MIVGKDEKPIVLCFAGPNGSGKSTVTNTINVVGDYINADRIKVALGCDDLTAAQIAEKRRNDCINEGKNFTFETVMSTPRNIELLRKAKEQGYEIHSVYVMTAAPEINIKRVAHRVSDGGHDVPKDKIVSRYYRSLELLSELVNLSEQCIVMDNTRSPFCVFEKSNGEYKLYENEYWDAKSLISITKVDENKFSEINKISSKSDNYYLMQVSVEQLEIIKESGIKYEYCRKEDKIAIRFNRSLKDDVKKLLNNANTLKRK